jgi:hypothetical protein
MVALADVTRELFQKLTERIDAAPQGDMATILMIENQVSGEMMLKFGSVFAQLQAAFSSTGAPAGEKKAEAPPKPDEATPDDEPQSGPPGRGRSPEPINP